VKDIERAERQKRKKRRVARKSTSLLQGPCKAFRPVLLKIRPLEEKLQCKQQPPEKYENMAVFTEF